MAKVYFIATLMILQGFFFLYGETTTTTTLVLMASSDGNNEQATTVVATPSMGGAVTTAMAGGTGTMAMAVDTVTTAAGGVGGGATVMTAMAGGGGGGTITTAAGGGGGGATVTTAMGGGGGGGTVTTAAGGGGGGATVTTAMGGGGGGGTATTAAGGGGSAGTVTTVIGGGGMSSSSTTLVSSVVPDNKKPGSTVLINLVVSTDCSGDRLNALNVSLQIDIKDIFTNEGFPLRGVTTKSISCNSRLNITLEVSFYTGIPQGKTIEGVFQGALESGDIANLTKSNTLYTITFSGVSLEYKPKEGQCQAICCNGGGGELTVQRVCTPTDKCEGIAIAEKKEDGHCHGDTKSTCPDTCDDGTHNSPSYALVTMLVIGTFTKTIAF